jgi:hypothetical protein
MFIFFRQFTDYTIGYIMKELGVQQKIVDHLSVNELDDAIKSYETLEGIKADLETRLSNLNMIMDVSKNHITDYANVYSKTMNAIKSIYVEGNTEAVDYSDLYDISDTTHYKVAPGVSIQAISVNSLKDIPSTPLYYVKHTQEFAVKINNVCVSGNIQQIQTANSAPHRSLYTSNDTVWKNSNFAYSQGPITNKNKYMRHIGNRDTLKFDVIASDASERSIRKKQTIHDMLICLCMDDIVSEYDSIISPLQKRIVVNKSMLYE